MNRLSERKVTPDEMMRLGRSLRRISRTSRDLMRVLEISEDAVRFSRKKKKTALPAKH
jgi:hypothetical protein